MRRFCIASLALLLVTLGTAQTPKVTTVKTAQGQTINVTMPAPVVNVPQSPITVQAPKTSTPSNNSGWFALGGGVVGWGGHFVKNAIDQGNDKRKAKIEEHQRRIDALGSLIGEVLALEAVATSLNADTYLLDQTHKDQGAIATPYAVKGMIVEAENIMREYTIQNQSLVNEVKAQRTRCAQQLAVIVATAEKYGRLHKFLESQERNLSSYLYYWAALLVAKAEGKAEQSDQIRSDTNLIVSDLRHLRMLEEAALESTRIDKVQIKPAPTMIGNIQQAAVLHLTDNGLKTMRNALPHYKEPSQAA